MVDRKYKSRYKIYTIYLPPEWKDLIKKRADQLGYRGITDYVRSLIRSDLEKAGLLPQ